MTTNDDNGTALGQKALISTIPKRFSMEEANGAATPMNTSVAEERNEKGVVS